MGLKDTAAGGDTENPLSNKVKPGHLTILGVNKWFADVCAVDNANLEIQAGEFFTLLGPSGCGKTTLLRMIAGFEQPSAGKIVLGNLELNGLPPEKRPLNMVFQSYALFPHLTVFDNVAFGLRAKRMPEEQVRQKVWQGLELVELTELAHRSARKLSGGQSQRVALARALVNEPSLLLLDEPLSALDFRLRKQLQIELRALQQRLGTTFVYVTHDQEEAFVMSHRVCVMKRARIEQVGTPSEIYHQPRTRFVAAFVGDTTFLPCTINTINQGKAQVTLKANGTSHLATLPPGFALDTSNHVALSVRPEDISLTNVEQGHVAGILEDIIFLGSKTRYLVRLVDGLVARVDTKHLPSAKPGDTVGLYWEEASGIIVGDLA